MSLAHDVDDIEWSNTGSLSKRRMILKLIGYLFICASVFVLIGFVEYIAAFSSFNVAFWINEACFTIPLGFIE